MQEYDLTNGNKIYIGNNVGISKDNIRFTGGEIRNNVIFLESNLNLGSSIIEFYGSNSLVFLGANKYRYHVRMLIGNNGVSCFGRNNYINPSWLGEPFKVRLAEHKNILIGNDNLFSWSIWLLNSDLHPIYSD